MTHDTTTITNRLGMHARPAAMFVSHASRFKSDIFVEKDGLKVNGKSIMGVMMLAAEAGSKLIIYADGEDEKEAVKGLVELIESGFGDLKYL
ncbi:MAG: phosphocarrier protein HPr [Candidatus Zixiibacteriota bacterium]|nr:MAG: phosphocarrier protein HPr [candidate division Zixibacteria bacterium]HHI03686.1 HPr family phosphocarrier protein [candidate division Zixibacteria bacterium]